MKNVAAMVALILWASGAGAEEWRRLSGSEIQALIPLQGLDYGAGITQTFDPSGETLYVSGRPSLGYWDVRGDQYCSVWPPSDIWTCYDVERSAAALRFIDSSGEISLGAFME